MKCNDMYFVKEMIKSCFGLALSVLCRMIIPLRRLAFLDGKEVMYLHHRLWMETPSLNVKVFGSECRGSLNNRDGLARLDGCQAWRGRAEGSPEADVRVYCSRVSTSHLGTHKQKILSEGSPQLRS